MPVWLGALMTRKMLICIFTGFSSGLPLYLLLNLLPAWLRSEGVDLKTIGFFALIQFPYTWKFLWSPLLDRFSVPGFGRRRGWMLLTQLCVAVGLGLMALTSPRADPEQLAAFALLVAFLSASLDIVFDAYRTDTLHPHERGLGAAVWVNGYRVALLAAGAGALVLADYVGWQATYLAMAAVMMAGLSAILLSPEPTRVADPPKSLAEAIGAPLREFFSRPQAIGFLAVIVLYKLGDAFASSLQTAFLIGGVGFSVTDVGAAKGIGVFATLFGALIGGVMMTRTGLVPSLLIFGLLQAVSNLGFALLAMVGKSSAMLMTAIVIENVTGGMGTAAFVALVMSLCDPRYTATQFALLSSLEALGRVFAGRPSAEIVDAVGWMQFFVFTLVVALPGIFAVWSLRHRIEEEQKERTPAFSPAA